MLLSTVGSYSILLILCYSQQLEVMVFYYFYVTVNSWKFWYCTDFSLLSTVGSYGIVLILCYCQQLVVMELY
jgi:hypothetical protein